MIENTCRTRKEDRSISARPLSYLTLWLLCVVATPAFGDDTTPKADAAKKPAGAALEFDGEISADDVRPHVEFLASDELQGRSGAQALVAANYIRTRFEKLGLKAVFAEDNYFQPIPGRKDEDGKPRIFGRNVAGWIPGSNPALRDEFVIISAHYDHLGVRNGKVHPGADDNASGVSMLLEVARQVAQAKIKPQRSMVFVGFDLEEYMLWGSRWFAAHPPWPLQQVKLFITADMIGRSLGDLPLSTVFVMGSEHAPELRDVLNRVGRPRGLHVARLGIDLIGTRSDYGPFRDRKIPFLFFSTGEHPDYHTPRDVPARINYGNVAGVSSLVYRISTDVANAELTPKWTDKPEADLDEVRALYRITSLLLDADGNKKLTELQRLVVSQTKIKTNQIVERGTITPGERTWLIRVSQLLLLSVF